MEFFKIGVHVGPTGPVWDDVQAGDGLVWDSGAIFIVKERAIDDGKDISFVVQCVTSGPVTSMQYGDLAQWHGPKWGAIPEHITVVKPTHE